MSRTPIHAAGYLLLMLVPTLRAQTAGRMPLTSEVVAAALTQNGLSVDRAQVELPVSLSSASADPQLYVAGADLATDGRLRVRLACRKAGECQPFLATVRLPSAPEAIAHLAALQGSLQPGRSPRSAVNERNDRIVAGQHATMLLENSRMRITLPVLVIDSGTPGTEVRVSSLDRKQTFRAVVTDPETVRGSLP